MTDEETLEQQIDQAIQALTVYHAGALAAAISTYYRAGSEDSREEQDSKAKKLSPLQEAAIQKMTAEHFGYMAEFDKAVGEAIKERAREILRNEGGYADIREEIKKYTNDVFQGKEPITINHIGQKKTILKVGKDGKLYEVEKVIEREYVSNAEAYSDMLSRTATHKAFEQGRASEYKRLKFDRWRFVGPADERARSHHVAILGNVYEYGTEQSDYALQLLGEPHCRHRAIPYFDDPELDTPDSFYQRQKDKAGLFWDVKKGEWCFTDN